MLFRKRKLLAARKMCEREIARTRYYLDAGTTMFGPAQRSEINSAISRLELAARNEEAPRVLNDDLKTFKHLVDRFLPPWKKSVVREYTEAIAIALVLALFIRTFIVQAFKIPSGSMIPTLLIGDHLIVNKFIYGFEVPFTLKKVLPFSKPKRGEIIVFRFPLDTSKDFIKRVVGVPGDRIAIRGGRLFVNDAEIPETRDGPYSYPDMNGSRENGTTWIEDLDGHVHKILRSDSFMPPLSEEFSTVVPEGKYFCMGDNRDRSNDSRYWGPVPFEYIRGKAMIIYFSWPPSQWLRIFKITR